MTSPYKNPWARKPYANPKIEASKLEAAQRRRALMTQLAVWSAGPAVLMIVVAAVAMR